MSKIWYITGTSSGLGQAWATAALDRGDKVAAIARSTTALTELSDRYGDAVLPITLDVTDREASIAAVRRAHAHFGRLDVVINNAGYPHYGFIEEITEAEARAQMETNFFGALWTTQAAVPLLREQGSGHIIAVSSVVGLVGFASLGLYSASKFALEGMMDALGQEVAGFGVRTTLIEPSGFATGVGASSVYSEPNPAYQSIRDAMSAQAGGSAMPTADDSVAAMLTVVDADEPPARLLLTSPALDIVLPAYEQRLQTWRQWESTSRSADARS